jgi:hypothetical protein
MVFPGSGWGGRRNGRSAQSDTGSVKWTSLNHNNRDCPANLILLSSEQAANSFEARLISLQFTPVKQV